jgi:hypothetical protein
MKSGLLNIIDHPERPGMIASINQVICVHRWLKNLRPGDFAFFVGAQGEDL